MIIEKLVDFLFAFINFIINLLPQIDSYSINIAGFFDILGFGISILGADLFALIIGSVITWTTIHLVYAIAEWCWKKIPGIS